MKKIIQILIITIYTINITNAQVDVYSTGGTPFATYSTLGAAFNGINYGTHLDTITILINASTNEGIFSAILEDSGVGWADYDRVYITPSVSGVIVQGTPGSGQAVVRINGGDNVTINGTVNGGSGGTRDLTIQNNNSIATSFSAAVWFASQGVGQGCNNDTIMNCNIAGIGAESGASTTYSIFAAGTNITYGASGADNDGLVILNNSIYDASYGIYVYGTSGGQADGLVIKDNDIGTSDPSKFIGYKGIDLTYTTSAIINGNEIHNINNKYITSSITGIEHGNGNTGMTISNNAIHNINNHSYGAYGINVTGGSGARIVNNMIYNITTASTSTLHNSYNPFGIRLGTANNVKVLYNSVNMTGSVTSSSYPGSSVAIGFAGVSANNCDIRNNIFQNKTTSAISGSKFYCVYLRSGVDFSTSIIDNNGYFIADDTPENKYYIGTYAGHDRSKLIDWRDFTGQDSNSLPEYRTFVNFISDSNLHIASSPSIIESQGTYVSDTTDIDNEIRQGAGGYSHVPSGIAPDIGCDEIASTPEDFDAPTFSGVSIAPTGGLCTATAHKISATISDTSGIASAEINYTVDSISYSNISMTDSAGIWIGYIPPYSGQYIKYWVTATDSSQQANVATSEWYDYEDEFLNVSLQDSIAYCGSEPAVLTPVTKYGKGSIVFSEITQEYTGTGWTNPYPSWVSGADLIEIANTGMIAVDVSDYYIEIYGGTTRTFTFPSGTIIPDSSVAVINIGTGTDNPSRLFFNTGGTNDDIASGEGTVYILRRFKNGPIVDIVTVNAYSIPFSLEIPASEWSGNTAIGTGTAGFVRKGYDNNTSSNWKRADSSQQSIGTFNSTLNYTAELYAEWLPGPVTGGTMTVSPGVETTYFLTISDSICYIYDTVTVSPRVVPTAPTVTGDTVCGLTSLNLTASGSPECYWYDTDSAGNLLTTGLNYSVSISSTDTFYVETNDGYCSSNRVPVIGVTNTPDSITGSVSVSPVCSGETVTLSVSSPNPSYTYTWAGEGLLTSTGENVQAIPASAGVLNYTITAQDVECLAVDSVHLKVYPETDITFVISDTTLCGKDTVTISPSGDDTETFTTSNLTQIYIPDNTAEGITSPLYVNNVFGTLGTEITEYYACINIYHTYDSDLGIYLISPSKADTLTLAEGIGTSGDNFINTCFYTSAVTVITSGIFPFSSTWIPQEGSLRAFDGEEASGEWNLWVVDSRNTDFGYISSWNMGFIYQHDLVYDWSSVPAGLSSTGDTAFDVALNSSTQYRLDLYDSVSGCTKTITQSVIVSPVINFGNDTVVCDGITLDAGNPGSTYLWSDMSTSQTLDVTTTGTYSVTISDTGGCINDDDIYVTVNTSPTATLSVTDTVCLQGAAFALSGGNPAGGIYSGTGVTSGNFDPAVAGLGATTITYTYTDVNGCYDYATDQIYVKNCSGIENIEDQAGISVYPNPVTDKLVICFSGRDKETFDLKVTNAGGQIIYSDIIRPGSRIYSYKLSTEHFAAGVYTISLISENTVSNIRLIKAD